MKSCDVQSKRLSIIFENNATILKQLCSHRTCIFSVTVSVWIFLMSQPGVGALRKFWFGIGIGIGKSNSDRVGWEYFGIGVEEI